LQEFYRNLLACLKDPEVRQGRWQLLEVRPAWDGNPIRDRFLAFAWLGKTHQRLLVTVNYGPTEGQCSVGFPFPEYSGRRVTLQDLMSKALYEREGDELLKRGLYPDLLAWGFHLFTWQGGAAAICSVVAPRVRLYHI